MLYTNHGYYEAAIEIQNPVFKTIFLVLMEYFNIRHVCICDMVQNFSGTL